MKSLYNIIATIAGMILLTTLLNAQEIDPPFNVNEVVDQVRQHNDFIDLRDSPFLIDTILRYGPNPDDNSDFPAIAFDGTNYLVVWHDDRNGDWNIFGSRISQTGEVIDEIGIEISSTVNDQMYPDVTFDGTNYVVVWESDFGIEAARVTPSGEVLDSTAITISSTGEKPAVIFGDNNYFVVWQDTRNSDWIDIYGARVDTSGVVIDTSGIAIAVADSIYQRSPDIAFDGVNFLVAWCQNNFVDWKEEIYATRVSQAGLILDTLHIQVFSEYKEWNAAVDPAIAFDGTIYLVVWEFYDWYTEYYMYARTSGARVDQEGNVLDPNGFTIDSTDYVTDIERTYPAAAFDGSNFLVTWTKQLSDDTDPLYGQRVSQAGTLIGSQISISAAPYKAYASSVVFGDTNYFVVWADQRSGVSKEIYGARVNTSGSVLDLLGIPISFSDPTAYAQYEPTMAFDGYNFLVAWEDEYGNDIYGARVTQSGVVLDSITIAISNSNDNLLVPKTVFNGTHYVVIWNSFNYYGYIRAARVSSSGVVLDTGGVTISGPAFNDNSDISIAFDGAKYFIAQAIDWWDGYEGGRKMVGKFVNQSLVVTGTLSFPWGADMFNSNPYISSDGTNYLMVYDQYGAAGDGIRAYTVNDSGWGPEIIISDAGKYPAVAFDGIHYLVVWHSGDGYPPTNNIYGRRVDPSGMCVGPSFVVCAASGAQEKPVVDFDGTNYWVIWQDYRNGEWDIYGAKVDTSGIVVDSFVISQQPEDQISPALAHGLGDRLLITYAGWTDSINAHPVNSMRIWGIISTDVGIKDEIGLNMDITQLDLQIRPNPFCKNVEITFSVGHAADHIGLVIYDVTGRVVKDFSLHTLDSQRPTVISWNGTDDLHRQLPSGIYFLKFELEDYSATEKLLLIR